MLQGKLDDNNDRSTLVHRLARLSVVAAIALLPAELTVAAPLDIHPLIRERLPESTLAALRGLADAASGSAGDTLLAVDTALGAQLTDNDWDPASQRWLREYLSYLLRVGDGDLTVEASALGTLLGEACCLGIGAVRAGLTEALAQQARTSGETLDSLLADLTDGAPSTGLTALVALEHLDHGRRRDAAHVLQSLGESAGDCGNDCASAALVALARAHNEYSSARLADALEQALLSLAHIERAPAADQLRTLPVLNELARLLVELSAPQQARNAVTLARQRSERLPAHHPYSLGVHVSEFVLTVDDGDTGDAAAQLDALLPATEALLPGDAIALALARGAFHYYRAEYAEGAAILADAAALIDARYGPDSPSKAAALNVLGILHNSTGDTERAIAAYRRCLAIRESVYADSHPALAEVSNNLGVLFHDLGRYDLAESYFERALDIDRRFYGPVHEEVASDLHNLAAVYRSMGAPQRAIRLLEEAVDIDTEKLGPRNLRTAIMHHGLGQAYLEAGAYELAIASLRTSVEIHAEIDPQSRSIPIGLHNLAIAANELGNAVLARDTLEQVLERYRAIYDEHHRQIASAERELAVALFALGEPDAANEHLLRAAETAAVVDAPEVQWRVFMQLANQQVEFAQPAAAIFFGKLGLEVLQQLRASQTTLGKSLRRAFARHRADAYRNVAGWLVDAGRLADAQRVLAMLRDEEFYEYTRREGFDARYQVSFTELEQSLRSRLDAARIQARGAGGSNAARSRYRQTLLDVRERLARSDVAGVEERVVVADVALSPAEARIEYLVGDDTLRLIVSTAQSRAAASVAIARRELRRKVFELRRQLQNPPESPVTLAHALYAVLIAPVAAVLDDAGVSRLLLDPDDVLRYLPFAALHDGAGYLVRRYATALLNEGAPVDRARDPDKRVAAFATTSAVGGFRALPAAAAEAESLVRRNALDDDGIFPGEIWLDDAFNRDTLHGALQSDYPIVHLASHFEVTPGNESDSFLLLGNGDRLSLHELRTGDYPLGGVELLTLSGCNTALASADADGREVAGFAGLAGRKGARQIVATMWPVEDDSAARFITRFYSQLAVVDSTMDALQNAQAEAIETHPFYWAPFTLWATRERPAPAADRTDVGPGGER